MTNLCRVVRTVAVTLVLAGCGLASTPSGSGDLGVDEDSFGLLTQSGGYHRGQHMLTVAEEKLVGRCMTARGLSYPAAPADGDQMSDEDRVLNLEQRRREGYGLFTQFSASAGNQPSAPADRYVQGLPPKEHAAYLHALFGDERIRKGIDLPGGGRVTFPGQGCLFESQSRLFTDIMTWARVTYLPEDLNNKLTDRIARTGDYAEGMVHWSRCMALRGYRYDMPDKLTDALSDRYAREGANERLRQQEIEAAVADAECARQTGLPQLVLSLKRSHLDTVSAEERKSLTELGHAWSRAVATAQHIA